MRKTFAMLLCVCMLVAVLCACGTDNSTPDTDPAETPEVTENVTPNDSSKDNGNNNESAKVSFDGTWHEKLAGRGEMVVTVSDDGTVCFDVKWADSATKTFVWQFAGHETEQGVVKFDNGFKGLLVVSGIAAANVDNDLVKLWNLHNILISKLLC